MGAGRRPRPPSTSCCRSGANSRHRAEFVSQAVVSDPGVYERAEADLDGFWLDQTRCAARLARGADQGARVGPAALHVVRRRRPERQPQLPRPARRRRSRLEGRLPLRPRAGRRGGAGDHLRRAPGRRLPDGERPARARHRQGRRRRDLHGHGAGAARRDAGLRPDRRAARRRLRRLLGGVARRAARVDGRQGAHHPGRGVAEGRGRRAQDDGRRGRQAGAVGREHGRPAAHRAPTCRCRTAAITGGTSSSPGQPDTCEPEQVDAEHMLYALHTSGTTAKPKAAVHTRAATSRSSP